jgi:hypothetical protein
MERCDAIKSLRLIRALQVTHSHPGTVGQSVRGKIRICDEASEEVPKGQRGAVYFERVVMPSTASGRLQIESASEVLRQLSKNHHVQGQLAKSCLAQRAP